MEYKFSKFKVSKSTYFQIDVSSPEHYVIGNLRNDNWTPTLAQEIINGVQKAKDDKTRYEWANEDIHLVALGDGVYFFDLMARRANKNHPSGQDLDLEHQEFIDFMKDFKQFIEENQ